MFDIHTSILDSEVDGELDEERLYSYIDALMTEFDESPEAEEFRVDFDEPIHWSAVYMQYAGEYFCVTPATIRHQETAEILFDIFPRKVSIAPEDAAEIIFELRAFWRFLKRTRSLASADAMLEMFEDDDAERLEAELADPENFGMAKSFVMAGMEAGFDMTDEDDVQRFMLAYNTGLLGKFAPVDREVEETEATLAAEAPPVATIRNDAPRVGRNSPCPCGSGRKYKKCCLR